MVNCYSGAFLLSAAAWSLYLRVACFWVRVESQGATLFALASVVLPLQGPRL
jgi:hypothetical protein